MIALIIAIFIGIPLIVCIALVLIMASQDEHQRCDYCGELCIPMGYDDILSCPKNCEIEEYFKTRGRDI